MYVCSRYFRITLFQSIRGTLQPVHSVAVHARPLSADRVQVAKQLPLATISFANATPPRPTERALKVTNAAERRLERRGG